jgi:hypothetical protein
MVARLLWFAGFMFLLLSSSCTVDETKSVYYLALVAPFEGEQSEIGYQALYAVRMALQEAELAEFNEVVLLAVDDGGNVDHAVERVSVLHADERVLAILALGDIAYDPAVQMVAVDVPLISAGYWGVGPLTDTSFVMASLEVARYSQQSQVNNLEASTRQFRARNAIAADVTLVASSAMPDAEFRAGYLDMGQFVPQPGLIAVHSYSTARHLLTLIDGHQDRSSLIAALQCDFLDGYLIESRVYEYRFNETGVLIPVDRVIE